MTTPDTPDDRDRQVAAWLDVEPLDADTRARLVRAAVDAAVSDSAGTADPTSARPLGRLLAVAAALVVLLAVGIAVLVPRSSDDTTLEATDAPTAESAPTDTKVAPSTDLERAPSAAAVPDAAGSDVLRQIVLALPSIGDLGNVSTPERLERAVTPRIPPATGAPTVSVPGCAADAGQAFGTPVATGTGRIDGSPAIVVVAEQAAGTTAVVAVRGADCGRAVSVVIR